MTGRARSLRAVASTALALVASAPLAVVACSPAPSAPAPDAGPTGCKLSFLGDATKPPTLEALALGADMTSVPIADGAEVTLAFPPQGGRVIFAGVRATNVDPCAVQLTGAIRDETTMQVRLDSRTINLLPDGDGGGASDPVDISTFANVPVCPNEWSRTNLYGTEYQLELSILDREGRAASLKRKVVPQCAEPAHVVDCLCICSGGYVLGETCPPPDAGASDAATDAASDADVSDGGGA
jgi:hypothetical protein